MNAYEPSPKCHAGLKNGALSKLCQKISRTGASTTTAVIATTVLRGRLKAREVMACAASA